MMMPQLYSGYHDNLFNMKTSQLLPALSASLPLAAAQSPPDFQTATAHSYNNPIIPGFHPDPSCTFVPQLNNTFFCTFSSFLTFPGLPIYASRDLINWKLISNAISRPEQLPALGALPRGSTSGIYAPTIRFRDEKFLITGTLANQALYSNNYTRWDNFILTSSDPYSSGSWSDPVHFDFPGIDPSPFWDDANGGQAHITGSFDGKAILQAPIDLESGEVLAPLTAIWNGTGLPSPEAPHIYYKDGWYYLLTAEGGTRERHRSNLARSKNLYGPYEGDPHNPELSAYLSPGYFQAVGHSDIFQDGNGAYWAIALGVRAGYDYNFDPYNSIFPMGREAQLTPVTWAEGDWPHYQNVTGTMTGNFTLPLGVPSPNTLPTGGEGGDPSGDDTIDFAPGSSLPKHLFHWRLPIPGKYAVSPTGHDNSLRLVSSVLNLTAFDADSTRGWGQTFVARRQAHTRFRYSVDVEWAGYLNRSQNEVGITALQDQAQHFDLSVTMLPVTANTSLTSGCSGPTNGTQQLMPHIRFRGISTTQYRLPERFQYVDESWPLPEAWNGKKARLQIEALNTTHYAFSAGLGGIDGETEMTVYGYTKGNHLIPYFSGVVVGPYATSNGKYGEGAFEAFVSRWRYTGLEQVRELPANQGNVTWP
jgi:beta-xylosidase